MGAGKSGPTATVVQLKVACSKTAMSTLPFVLLKTHVYMMAKQVVVGAGAAGLRAVGAFQGGKNRGRCHKPQRGPRIRLARRGPCSACSRGSAKPRQPGSSPSAPPVKNA